jgi:7-cyano-7-deazaguanine synthase
VCSISGLITLSPSQEKTRALFDIIVRAEERGRDGFGIGSPEEVFKWYGRPSFLLKDSDKITVPNILISNVLLNNNRAEPTTEYVAKKTDNDIQPFEYHGTLVAHNGIIANDKELMQKYSIETNTLVDSAVIGPLVHKLGVEQAIRELVGSYALAIYHDGKVYLACNYKPIFLKWDVDSIYFSSMDRYLRTTAFDNITQLPPYSMTTIYPESLRVETISLRPPSPKRKVLVICSGGIDSTVVAAHYHAQDSEMLLLHFLYGCKAERKEVQAVKDIAGYYDCGYKLIDVRGLMHDEIGGSPLFDGDIHIDKAGESAAEIASEWVPARNLVFYSLALAYAEAHGYNVIALGNNLEESGAYPDNEMIFVEKFAQLIPNAVNLDVQIAVEQPVGNLMKHEIVAYGVELKAPLSMAWSCYKDSDEPCGVCGSCYYRAKAFAMNNLEVV